MSENLALDLIAALGRTPITRFWAKRTLKRAVAAGRLPPEVYASINGVRVRLDLNEALDRRAFVYGAHDRRGVAFILRLMRAIACRTAFDIGANIGNHSFFMREAARRVFAFEPNPAIFARLQETVMLNGLETIEPVPFGLSDRTCSLPFHVRQGKAGSGTLELAAGATSSHLVKVMRGDDFVRDAGIDDLDFMKIDIEGHEREALSGLTGTITDQRPLIVMEFYDVSLAKFGGGRSLGAALPGYRFFGNRLTLASRLFKSSFAAEPMRFDMPYSHLLCVPQEKAAILKSLLS